MRYTSRRERLAIELALMDWRDWTGLIWFYLVAGVVAAFSLAWLWIAVSLVLRLFGIEVWPLNVWPEPNCDVLTCT